MGCIISQASHQHLYRPKQVMGSALIRPLSTLRYVHTFDGGIYYPHLERGAYRHIVFLSSFPRDLAWLNTPVLPAENLQTAKKLL